MEENLQKFIALGLSESKAKETLKNATVTKNLLWILDLLKCESSNNIPNGMLFYHFASKLKPQINNFVPKITDYIKLNKLDTTLRVDKAIEYTFEHLENFSDEEFAKFCGIGVVVSLEDVENEIEKLINENKEEIINKRYKFNQGLLMQKVREKLPFVDGKIVKNELDVQFLTLLGPKNEQDLAPVAKKKDKKTKPEDTEKKSETIKKVTKDEEKNAPSIIDVMGKVNFHKVGENYKTDGYVLTDNTHELLRKHVKETGGKVRTRFPPEPNGILHIGHAKAININFGYALATSGECYLRYDDTNPEKEEEIFFIGIKDMVEWLGYKPVKITYSSDYFNILYEYAIELIKLDKAYVCHQTADEIKGFNPPPSPWRNRPIPESLNLFQSMKNGKLDENSATLRLKVQLEEGKQDPVAYRIRFVPHPRTGNDWCIYPTYDYTHCLCDSIENITHSLCTKEFQSRRSSYYWLCNALNLYCPVQWEYGRLNMDFTITSKRKILKLIESGVVKSWDDPRLFTLSALRRRGIPYEVINTFCARLGVTGSQTSIDPKMFDYEVRNYLNKTSERTMVVIDPLKITIVNFPYDKPIDLTVPKHPSDETFGSRTVKLCKTVYIEGEDFRKSNAGGFKRLTLEQTVGLRYTELVLNVKEIIENDNGISELICECKKITDSEVVKPKSFIHWVSDPIKITVNQYSQLFNHRNPEDPNEVPNGWLSDCNLDSWKIIDNALADKSILNVKVYDRFQFERLGYFSVDPDTSSEKIVFNCTVGLKEDAGK